MGEEAFHVGEKVGSFRLADALVAALEAQQSSAVAEDGGAEN